ncbi:hypothetical protein MVEN_00160800 [Mycena venus]|uniref:Uncharacterized protein n=1 Tax=Mycena venus TaxID=2733690 RepID=A0A8H6Z0W8_9AGAR|nr:hypothetical protein MVEN_00160800 [Mycena venus]
MPRFRAQLPTARMGLSSLQSFHHARERATYAFVPPRDRFLDRNYGREARMGRNGGGGEGAHGGQMTEVEDAGRSGEAVSTALCLFASTLSGAPQHVPHPRPLTFPGISYIRFVDVLPSIRSFPSNSHSSLARPLRIIIILALRRNYLALTVYVAQSCGRSFVNVIPVSSTDDPPTFVQSYWLEAASALKGQTSPTKI